MTNAGPACPTEHRSIASALDTSEFWPVLPATTPSPRTGRGPEGAPRGPYAVTDAVVSQCGFLTVPSKRPLVL